MDTKDKGWLLGVAGVAIFSGSLPATRAGLTGFEPLFMTGARAVLAALAGALLLAAFTRRRPAGADVPPLLVVAATVVVGFPLLSALALTHISASRGLLFTGLLPLSTAMWSLRQGTARPRSSFWAFALAGAVLLAAYALTHGGARGAWAGDALMAAAIVVCGLGYAQGAALAHRLGGWEVICWALLLSLPVMLPVTLSTWPAAWPDAASPAWWGLGYVALFSMLIGFFFWYRALALGGPYGVGQLQLLQPLMGIALSALLLGEAVTPALVLTALAILACVAGARRAA